MSTSTHSSTDQLVAELYKADGKAEIVGGEIVPMSPTGEFPNRAAGSIFASLRLFEKSATGRAFTDNVAYLVELPNRRSFCPDVSFHTGPSTGMKFLDRAPDFAVEVRSESDYGPAAERQLEAKRADYFAAGTKVVWDVDLLSEDVVRVYRSDSPSKPVVYQRGQRAAAEPAVPGWSISVDELFD